MNEKHKKKGVGEHTAHSGSGCCGVVKTNEMRALRCLASPSLHKPDFQDLPSNQHLHLLLPASQAPVFLT